MSYMDMVKKWLFSPKTIKGTVGMAIILLVLAADFWWWANNIDISGNVAGAGTNGDGNQVEEWEIVRDVDESIPDSLTLPSFGRIIIVGTSVKSYDFEVKERAVLGFINVTVTGTNAKPDLDLRVYGPDGKMVGESATTEADEKVFLNETSLNRTGPGTYTAKVENFSSFNVQYTLTIQIDIKVPKESTEEEP